MDESELSGRLDDIVDELRDLRAEVAELRRALETRGVLGEQEDGAAEPSPSESSEGPTPPDMRPPPPAFRGSPQG